MHQFKIGDKVVTLEYILGASSKVYGIVTKVNSKTCAVDWWMRVENKYKCYYKNDRIYKHELRLITKAEEVLFS